MKLSVCDTVGKMNDNISLKIEQNLYTKHHQIDQKTSNFHIFFSKKIWMIFHVCIMSLRKKGGENPTVCDQTFEIVW